ncbi:MAG: RNA polymerase-associated protein RapA, partial [Gammaproteobacteria bacterium]|nr:RNA polymerase-associated protein RapA [Gammaproteobacteria bacterium]
MHDFIPGQRWISDTESELGLGTVRQADFRRVTFHFPASNEIRVYAKDNAPLTRVRFSPGDLIENLENCFLKVDSVAEDAGLLTYTGTDKEGVRRELPEAELSHFIQFSRPQDRLLAGRFDSGRRFALRYATLQEYNQIEQSPVWGLCGARINLIPHQLYIAHRAAGRYAPRILLADETGLGKTIEAGLILHRQLLSGRAQRVLLVVPESLLHQWLVEMLRRFNLRFSIFDEERCQSGDSFASEQLVLCSLDFFIARPEYHVQALAGEWDLLVVDEAHHLEWSEAEASPAYVLIEQLAERTKGVLLLTATPEQLGQTGHFARLRLLDPDRFYDFNAFCQEQSQYEPTARAVEQLLEQKSLSSGAVKNLMSALEEAENRSLIRMLDDPDAEEAAKNQARERLISQLLDRHGTGRVLFRNTRAAVQGFPDRRLHIYPLPFPDKYRACIRQSGGDGLYPEQTCRRLSNRNVDTACRPKAGDKNSAMPAAANVKPISGWQTFDPRVTWLMEMLDALKPDKVLVICASAQTALELEQVLRTRAGILAAAFHEGMNIVRRDRVAAWFA